MKGSLRHGHDPALPDAEAEHGRLGVQTTDSHCKDCGQLGEKSKKGKRKA